MLSHFAASLQAASGWRPLYAKAKLANAKRGSKKQIVGFRDAESLRILPNPSRNGLVEIAGILAHLTAVAFMTCQSKWVVVTASLMRAF
jgi:hypothetical protein